MSFDIKDVMSMYKDMNKLVTDKIKKGVKEKDIRQCVQKFAKNVADKSTVNELIDTLTKFKNDGYGDTKVTISDNNGTAATTMLCAAIINSKNMLQEGEQDVVCLFPSCHSVLEGLSKIFEDEQ
jgi:hypothetical protein